MMLLRSNENQKKEDNQMLRILKQTYWFIYDMITSSELYFNMYYKHTKQHKKDINKIKEHTIKLKKELFNE